MTKLDEIAKQLELTGRTLRRAVLRGTIRGTRRSPRRFDIEPQEREYIRRYWPLLSRMLRVLRTQPNVRLAVLFGSVSRGEERRDSDLDVLVRFAEPSVHALSLLTGRLEEETGRAIQVVELESAVSSPLLLADVLRDGRVLVDRDGEWQRLKQRERQVKLAAAAENERAADEMIAAFEQLFV